MRFLTGRVATLILLFPTTLTQSWDISLRIDRYASNGVGGEELQSQPMISVYNKAGTRKQIDLVGKITATLAHPFNHELLGMMAISNNVCSSNGYQNGISFHLNAGEAHFSGLCINKKGSDYSIRLVLFDEFGINLGHIVQSNLSVDVGEPYQIGVIKYPQAVFGGIEWDMNPVVAVQDKGQNTVTSVKNGTVMISLADNSFGEELIFSIIKQVNFTEVYKVISPSRLEWTNGTAEFQGISINRAGYGYQLVFSTDLDLPGSNECQSGAIDVLVGDPVKLKIIEEPGMSRVYGGKVFPHQPILHVLDKGNNIVKSDSNLWVAAILYANPTKTLLQPMEPSVTHVKEGVAKFKHLFLDKAGERYRFKYFLLKGDSHDIRELTATNVTVLGNAFDVLVGDPDGLTVIPRSIKSWAENRPFSPQPKVFLVDAGGNVLKNVSDVDIDVVMVQSLSQTSDIVIDTFNCDVPLVDRIVYHPSILNDYDRTTYSYGHVLYIDVYFSEEVTVQKSKDHEKNDNESLPPSLVLNVMDQNGEYAQAYLSGGQYDFLTDLLTFFYDVSVGYEQSFVDILNGTSLLPNDYTIRDAWGRDANLSLSYYVSNKTLQSSKQVVVNNDPTVIQNIKADVDDGYYGAGHSIDFIVEFTHEVLVKGSPKLALVVQSLILVIDTISMGTSLSTSYFFILYKNERSRSIPWDATSNYIKDAIEGMNSISGEVCVSRSHSIVSAESGGYRWAIRFDDSNDDLRENIRTQSALVAKEHKAITLSFNLHQQDEPFSDWDTIDGDITMCTFRHATYVNGTGSKKLVFNYNVLPGDKAVPVRIQSPSIIRLSGPDDSISKHLVRQEMVSIDIAVDLKWNDQISNTAVVDTNAPNIVNVTIYSTCGIEELHRVGDEILINVIFDKPVVLLGFMRLKMMTIRPVGAFASFHAKPNRQTVTFRYFIEEGHWSRDLDLKNHGETLHFIGDSGAVILHDSTFPVTAANLTFGHVNIPNIRIDGKRPVIEEVGIPFGQEGKVYGKDDALVIAVIFSCPVVVMKGPPVMIIDAGSGYKEAEYFSGNKTSTLNFRYIIEIGDGSSEFLKVKMLCIASGCFEGSSKEGYIRQLSSRPSLNVDLTLPKQNISATTEYFVRNFLSINTRHAGKTNVRSIELLHDGGNVGVGEVIRMHVTFSDRVYCQGDLKLRLNTMSRAVYENGSGTQKLTFVLKTILHDVTKRLNWVINDNDTTAFICKTTDSHIGSCSITNGNHDHVNLSLVDDFGQFKISHPLSPAIELSATSPKIISIHANASQYDDCSHSTMCEYSAGDVIIINVRFDQKISIQGNPRMKLACYDGVNDYVYATFDAELSNEMNAAFKYVVLPGHATKSLPLSYYHEEIDVAYNNVTFIKRKSTYPIVSADILLPDPAFNQLRIGTNKFIVVDAVSVPSIRNLRFKNVTGIYSPGDRILLAVEFDKTVEVSGVPVLLLNVGRGKKGCAYFSSGSDTLELIFHYDVGLSHSTDALEYVGRYSLVTNSDQHCKNANGWIRRASANSIIDADLLLPRPGSFGSLSYNSTLTLDSRVPFISKIWSPQSPGIFKAKQAISILVQFSRSVIVHGSPMLLLETGSIDRWAHYKSKFNDLTLEFEYVVRLGDTTDDLEYWTDEDLIRTSVSSFNLNGGSIMVPATKPILMADIHINPSRGSLYGQNAEVNIIEGEADYLGLKIGQRGNGYRLRFLSVHNSRFFEAETSVTMQKSCEYEVNGNENDRNFDEGFGSAVALLNGLLAVSAPKKKVPKAEVQVLKVLSEALETQLEVQTITTQVDTELGTRLVQKFSTFADIDEEINGMFSLAYNDPSSGYFYSSEIFFTANAEAQFVKEQLTEKIPILKKIEVTRHANTHCKCKNGWTWEVTFFDASSGIGPLITNGIALEGGGAGITTSEVVSPTNMLHGFFTLLNPFTSMSSRNISFAASAKEMKSIIEQDLAIRVQSVRAGNLDPRDIAELGRRWIITYSSYIGPYGEDANVPNLKANGTFLSGANSKVWTYVEIEGKSPLQGSLAFSFRGSNYSSYIPFDASAEIIKQALESLESINEVEVSTRQSLPIHHGFTWAITFYSVNVWTDYGWMIDPGATSSSGNIPALELNSRLIGWRSKAFIESVKGYGDGDTQSQWMLKEMGDDGHQAGEVVVYRQVHGGWTTEYYLNAKDRNADDRFGHSVAFGDDMLAVGAPNKEVYGVVEQQTVTCLKIPSGGNFTLGLRGRKSDPIPIHSSLDDIQNAIQGIYGDTNKVHSIPRIDIVADGAWSQSKQDFCSSIGNTFTISFLTPDGGGVSTLENVSGDIELLDLDERNVINGKITITETRKGTRTLSGSSTLGLQSGAVYLFERKKSCRFCPYEWQQSKKFSILDCHQKPEGSEQFGWSVAIHGNTIFVGAPGFRNNTGNIYIFEHKDDGRWTCDESLTGNAWKEATPGARFGYSIAINSAKTVLVGAPGYSFSEGRVLVFRQSPSFRMLLSQLIASPSPSQGTFFGHAISLHNNIAIICAPKMMQGREKSTGACFTFHRRAQNQNYVMKQKLVASNVRKFDRFGWSVTMSRDKILVGQLQEYDGQMAARSTVQTITMRCGQQSCSKQTSSRFQLSWRDGLFTTNPLPYDISAKQLKKALENDLHTGPVQVHRTDNADKNSGFQWSITFMSRGLALSNENITPKLKCEAESFNGSTSRCDVDFSIGGGRYHIRGKVHLFTSKDGQWVEQAYLFPSEPQLQDFFGHAIALQDNIAVVGAPNRNLLEINSGAAIIFDLSFANYYFNSSSYVIEEGATLQIPIFRRNESSNDVLGIQSLDINAEDSLQKLVKMLWGPFPDGVITPVETLTGNTASTYDQYYGSMDNRSEWISGMYDYRAMNDYQSLNYQFKVATDNFDVVDLKTVGDHIFEAPNEKLIIQISLPGMFASPLGQLRTEITIEDDGDGVIHNETYYSKICKSSYEVCQSITSDMDVLPDSNVIVVGHDSLGLVQLLSLSKNNLAHLHDIYSPSNITKSGRFGESVSIDQPFGRDEITILIGEPGHTLAHIYVYDKMKNKLLYHTQLYPFGNFSLKVEHNFACRKSVKLDGDLAIIGAPNLGAVFIYRRIFDWETSKFSWHPWTMLRARVGFQAHGFGTAIDASNRKILVSAPNAIFSSTKDFIDTFGHHKTNLGKGYVHAFYSRPHSLQIDCVTEKFPVQGTFKAKILQNNHTSLFSFDEIDINMKSKLESLTMLGEVFVTKSQTVDEDTGSITFSWTISLLSIFQDEIPTIVLLWHGHNCDDCEPFMSTNKIIYPNISITHNRPLTEFAEESVLSGADPINEDCFGFSVDIDGDRAVVGAPCSSATPQTSWDFETGNLIGWFKTGEAFDYQPTYGDNSRKRNCYNSIGRIDSYTFGAPQDAEVQGRYYIGTYEKRPGDPLDILIPNTNHQEGDTQGDGPVGTLTSDPFMIRGNQISFLIGGGCDYLTVYIELVVDGFATLRATGQCHETMERVHWSVALYKGRSAQIRIVDASSDQWGHINVDDIKFSWAGDAFPISESSSKSGVAYVFRRQCTDSNQIENCKWIQEQRLIPSDKRTNNLFGASVAIDAAKGIISVGSPNSPAYGFSKETQAIFPFHEQPIYLQLDSALERLMKSGDVLTATPDNPWHFHNPIQNSTYILPMKLPCQDFEKAGALYIYTNQQKRNDKIIEHSKTWSISEQARLSPPDVMANDLFGSALKRTKSMIVVSSESGNFAYFFNLRWQNVKFSSIEYVAIEGVDSKAIITVMRDDISAQLSIGYSTSDLTAIGVDRHKFHTCSNLRLEDRSGCGDYEQSSGILTFATGQNEATFNISIVDDSCRERHIKYVQLNLHITGAAAIQGEHFRAQLRIDDDDWMGQICPTGIS